MTTARGISLQAATSPYVVNKIDGIRLRIDVTGATNMPTKIFAYQSLPMRPSTGERAAEFDHVCSPPDLADFPEDAPIPGQRPDWFRTSFVDVFLRSEADALRMWNLVIADVSSLKLSLDTCATLQPYATIDIGAPVTTSSSA